MAPANSRTPCTDAEFLELWERLKSPAKLARHLGISERGVYSRRRTIEERTGSTIEANGPITPRVPKHGAEHKLRVAAGSVVVFSDRHVWPGDRPSLAEIGLLHILDTLPNIKAVICNGDLADLPQMSRYPPTEWAEYPSVKAELEACQEFMQQIEERVPHSVPLLFNFGNHDSRMSVRIASHLPELAGVNGCDFRDHFSERWSWAWSTFINEGLAGGATLVKHRWKGGVHAPHNNAVNAGVNVVTGHLHQCKVSPFTDVNGRRYGVDTGTLARFRGEQKFTYLENSPVNWSEGFCVLTYDHEGKMAPPSLGEVIRNQCWFRGEVIAAE